MAALLARTTAVLVLIALTGCVDLEPRQSNIRYYVLTSETLPDTTRPSGAPGARPEPADTSGLVLGMRRLRIASYLDTPTIVTRMGPHEVHFGEFHRWGEDLPSAINRTVARYLTARPDVQRVDVVPWPDLVQHDYLIQLHVYRFEGEAPDTPADAIDPDARGLRHVGEPGTVRVVASWEIIDPADEAVVAQGTTDRRLSDWTVGRYGELVERLDTALQALADDLATAMP